MLPIASTGGDLAVCCMVRRNARHALDVIPLDASTPFTRASKNAGRGSTGAPGIEWFREEGNECLAHLKP